MRALAELTTLRLGGRAERLVEARTEAGLVDAVREAGDHLLVLAGGSNVVVADEGVPGTVVLVATRGVAEREEGVLEVQAGEPWEPFVARCVEAGLAGIECLSGIPGSVGATPIQNVGAYGQDVARTVREVRALDRSSGEVRSLTPAECEFSYRSSRFKREPGRWVVLAVAFALARHDGGESEPIRYPELARALGVEVGERAALQDVREAVLALRRGKGMVVDPEDPDSVSVGSFFTNPVLSPDDFAALEARVRERLGPDVSPPRFPEPDGRIKTSAAWLVERSGIGRGFGLPGPVAVSTKHTLALTNRGGATTAQLVALARQIAAKVHAELGVELVPEPVFVGHAWAALSAPGD
ncbi:MAG: UDP-N-acetylmuramate dehydrogenase [Actinomycetota bacterium]|nr:UDP-N-acetylmuramate dehydrogenase [Actinomycetota bacterium]